MPFQLPVTTHQLSNSWKWTNAPKHDTSWSEIHRCCPRSIYRALFEIEDTPVFHSLPKYLYSIDLTLPRSGWRSVKETAWTLPMGFFGRLSLLVLCLSYLDSCTSPAHNVALCRTPSLCGHPCGSSPFVVCSMRCQSCHRQSQWCRIALICLYTSVQERTCTATGCIRIDGVVSPWPSGSIFAFAWSNQRSLVWSCECVCAFSCTILCCALYIRRIVAHHSYSNFTRIHRRRRNVDN